MGTNFQHGYDQINEVSTKLSGMIKSFWSEIEDFKQSQKLHIACIAKPMEGLIEMLDTR